jgi:crotonobetainyl-CoA:carnitine CoA-transferase CaiB-like acyl-CoA transferase
VLPLDGIRVLDLSGDMGAYGTRLLALAGADVVKVEPPAGDRQRRRTPFASAAGRLEGSLEFAYYNVGKRGVVVDFADPDAEAALRRLAQGTDLILIAPSARAPVPGWDPVVRHLAWAEPLAIVCCLTSFGNGGPDDDLRATHMISYAASGHMRSVGPPEGPPRAMPSNALYDELSANAAAVGVAALRERSVVGGQVIELSVHDMLAYRDSVQFALYAKSHTAMSTRAVGNAQASPPTGLWDTADGQVEFLVFNPPHWDGFFELVGRPDELAHPEMRVRAFRNERAEELMPLYTRLIKQMTTEEIVSKAQTLRVPCAPRMTLEQVANDAQLIDRGFWAEYRHPAIGTFRAPGLPFKSRPALLELPDRPAPLLGEHNEELLAAGPASPKDPSSSAPSSPVPLLTSLRVVSFGTAIAGNVSATTLAEMGADVIKIESPGRPDPLRTGPFGNQPRIYEPSGVETNLMFSAYSRSCRSVGLDMKDPADRETFMSLVADADVLIDNYAAGTMAGWGLTHEALAAHNPRLIMITVSGYGRTGPRSHYMAYGSNINSFMGLTRIWAPHGTQFDYTAVAHVLFAIFTALCARDRTGEGTYVDIAQVEAGGAMMAPLYLPALNFNDATDPEPNSPVGAALAAVLRCAGDDQWVALELEDEADLAAAAKLVGHAGAEGLGDALAVWAARYAAEQAMTLLQSAGLAAAAVRDVEDEFHDAQLWGRGDVIALDHPYLGAMLYPAPFQRATKTPIHIRRPQAALGAHTEEVLRDWLGTPATTQP